MTRVTKYAIAAGAAMLAITAAQEPSRSRTARRPFQAATEIRLLPGVLGQGATIDVPAGKRLVIEFASGDCFADSNGTCVFQIFTRAGGSSQYTRYSLLSQSMGTFNFSNFFQTAQALKLYADPGNSVVLRIDRDQSFGQAVARMSLSGYLLDAADDPTQ